GEGVGAGDADGAAEQHQRLAGAAGDIGQAGRRFLQRRQQAAAGGGGAQPDPEGSQGDGDHDQQAAAPGQVDLAHAAATDGQSGDDQRRDVDQDPGDAVAGQGGPRLGP